MDCYLQKMPGDVLSATDDQARECLAKLKLGQPVKVSVKRVRNYEFHKKFFALLNYGFEFWEPPELPDDAEQRWRKNVTPEKNFDQFRKDVTILAGFYHAHYRLDGSVRIEAKSISFASMSEDEFERLYSAAIDVLLKHVFTNMAEDELRERVDELLRFAA